MSATDTIRDTLFGDMPMGLFPQGGSATDEFPWGLFVSAREYVAAGKKAEAIALWQKILEYAELESRCRLQAWHFLRQNEHEPPPESAKQVLGVVVEVALPEGLDLLAAYADRTARYYNFSGSGIVWERPNGSLDAAIDSLLEAAREAAEQIGPSQGERPGPPPVGSARLCFLTPSGLHFGEGTMEALSQDPLSSRILMLATQLMLTLIT